MSQDAFDQPGKAQSVEGEVTLLGPGKTGLSLTPDAARRTAASLEAAARDADAHAHAAIDLDDPDATERWAEHFGVSAQAVRNAVIEVGPTVEAVALRLRSARGAAD